LKRYAATWRETNPTWTQIMWTDQMAAEFVEKEYPEFYPTYTLLDTGSEKADLFRYLVVHKHGGVYADIDTECRASFDDIIKPQDTLVVGMENDKDLGGVASGYVREKQILQWVFASSAGHPVLLDAARRLVKCAVTPSPCKAWPDRVHTVLERSGPGIFTDAIEAYQKLPKSKREGWSEVSILPKPVFGTVPFIYEAVKKPYPEEAAVVHHFQGGWRPDAESRPWEARVQPIKPKSFASRVFRYVGAKLAETSKRSDAESEYRRELIYDEKNPYDTYSDYSEAPPETKYVNCHSGNVMQLPVHNANVCIDANFDFKCDDAPDTPSGLFIIGTNVRSDNDGSFMVCTPEGVTEGYQVLAEGGVRVGTYKWMNSPYASPYSSDAAVADTVTYMENYGQAFGMHVNEKNLYNNSVFHKFLEYFEPEEYESVSKESQMVYDDGKGGFLQVNTFFTNISPIQSVMSYEPDILTMMLAREEEVSAVMAEAGLGLEYPMNTFLPDVISEEFLWMTYITETVVDAFFTGTAPVTSNAMDAHTITEHVAKAMVAHEAKMDGETAPAIVKAAILSVAGRSEVMDHIEGITPEIKEGIATDLGTFVAEVMDGISVWFAEKAIRDEQGDLIEEFNREPVESGMMTAMEKFHAIWGAYLSTSQLSQLPEGEWGIDDGGDDIEAEPVATVEVSLSLDGYEGELKEEDQKALEESYAESLGVDADDVEITEITYPVKTAVQLDGLTEEDFEESKASIEKTFAELNSVPVDKVTAELANEIASERRRVLLESDSLEVDVTIVTDNADAAEAVESQVTDTVASGTFTESLTENIQEDTGKEVEIETTVTKEPETSVEVTVEVKAEDNESVDDLAVKAQQAVEDGTLAEKLEEKGMDVELEVVEIIKELVPEVPETLPPADQVPDLLCDLLCDHYCDSECSKIHECSSPDPVFDESFDPPKVTSCKCGCEISDAFIGGIIGGAVGLVLIIAAVVYYCCCKKRKQVASV